MRIGLVDHRFHFDERLASVHCGQQTHHAVTNKHKYKYNVLLCLTRLHEKV
jgi:hypothetical protein